MEEGLEAEALDSWPVLGPVSADADPPHICGFSFCQVKLGSQEGRPGREEAPREEVMGPWGVWEAVIGLWGVWEVVMGPWGMWKAVMGPWGVWEALMGPWGVR